MKIRRIISPQDSKSQKTEMNSSWGENLLLKFLWFYFLCISIRIFGRRHYVKLGTDCFTLPAITIFCSMSLIVQIQTQCLSDFCLCCTEITLSSLSASFSYPCRSFCTLLLSLTDTHCTCPPTAAESTLHPRLASSPIPSSPAGLSQLLYSACTHRLFSVVLLLPVPLGPSIHWHAATSTSVCGCL